MMFLIPITLGFLTWWLLRRPSALHGYSWMDELRDYHAEPVKRKDARELLTELGFELEEEEV